MDIWVLSQPTLETHIKFGLVSGSFCNICCCLLSLTDLDLSGIESQFATKLNEHIFKYSIALVYLSYLLKFVCL